VKNSWINLFLCDALSNLQNKDIFFLPPLIYEYINEGAQLASHHGALKKTFCLWKFENDLVFPATKHFFFLQKEHQLDLGFCQFYFIMCIQRHFVGKIEVQLFNPIIKKA